MYKPRRSKYFTLRCEGIVRQVTRKYVYATLIYLDDNPEQEIKKDDEDEVKIPITLFCVEHSIPKKKIKRGFVFCLYLEQKSSKGKKKLILEERKFPPTNTKTFQRGVKRTMKMYCQVLHGDNWKEVWKSWQAEEKGE